MLTTTRYHTLAKKKNTKLIETISGNFGNLAVSIGNKHKLLGMDIVFLFDGKLSLFMKDYLN